MKQEPTQLEAATRAYIDEDYQSALISLTPLAKEGDAEAQFLLALMYRNGEGVNKDEKAALMWIQSIHELAEKGDLKAQWLLGRKYQFGDNVPLNEERAFYWYEKAADEGYADAEFHLSRLYLRGNCGLEQSFELADYWLAKSVEHKHPEALYTFFLEKIFKENKSNPDLSKLKEAAEYGFKPAIDLLKSFNE